MTTSFVGFLNARTIRHLTTMAIIVVTALAMLLFGGFVASKSASAAATAPAAAQCDPPAFPTGAGFEVTCTINIANTVILSRCQQFHGNRHCLFGGRRSTPAVRLYDDSDNVQSARELGRSVQRSHQWRREQCDLQCLGRQYRSNWRSHLWGDGQSVCRLGDGRWYTADGRLCTGCQHDQRHGDPMQRLREQWRCQHTRAVQRDRRGFGRAGHH